MFIIIMGVSGSGKTTIAQMLAKKMDWPFYDGDDFHPPANINKMAAGIPLDDDDRSAWLDILVGIIHQENENNQNGVIACSALKQSYRNFLSNDPKALVKFVYLKGSFELILERMQYLERHFMKPVMLKSQFEALEEPADSFTISITHSQGDIVDQIINKVVRQHYDLGILGLGVMGRSLAQNFQRNGYTPLGFDPHPKLMPGTHIATAASLEELIRQLPTPRILFLMVPAGTPVDSAIQLLKPFLQAGDLIIDGGNSYFTDTERRTQELEEAGLYFIGMGVSGGESGALWGPSLMPGGSSAAWPLVQKMFEAIAAKTEDGESCVSWMGPGGAGHYIKMVHNGIEYGDMQLIAEIYDLLHRGAKISNQNLSQIFAEWNRHELRSYLIEITASILSKIDDETDQSLVDVILDEAAQKGTGKWTSQNSFELGAATPTINSAVESRNISALKEERVLASEMLGGAGRFDGNVDELIDNAEKALYTSKIISYAQGLSLMKKASIEYDWGIDAAQVVSVWRAGCIIRADLLNDISRAFKNNPDLSNLLLDDTLKNAVLSQQNAWRDVIRTAVTLGIPMLATCSALAYFDAYRSAVLPANLTQAQRDFFGAHTYRRLDKEGSFHTEWDKTA